MGQKVHPVGFRLGVVKGWQSRWYAERDYKDILTEDLEIRKTIHKELANAAVSKIEIERAAANQVLIRIYTAKPGIVIGKSGEKVEKLNSLLAAKTRKRVRVEIHEIRQPELDAYLVARGIAEQLEKRISFRRAMKQAVQKAMRANAKGIKIIVGGRLGGAEIARSEKEVEGKVPLHTLRADIDYGLAEAHTTFGLIGIKVWIYKGDVLPSKRREGGEGPQEFAAQPTPTTREGYEGGERRQRPRGERTRQGERPQGERPPRQPRPQGERPSRPQGERAPRPQGERPQGERPPRQPRPQGERPQGERPPRQPRPQGERPQGERPPRQPRPQGEERPQGERPPRQPRLQGEERPQGERPPRPQGEERPARAEQAPAAPQTPPAAPTLETEQSEEAGKSE